MAQVMQVMSRADRGQTYACDNKVRGPVESVQFARYRRHDRKVGGAHLGIAR